MQKPGLNAPPPDLRIVAVERLHPHETHDSQRSAPLIERMRHEEYIINPPVVTPLGASQFVILDGANRCYVFGELGFPHILVQVSSYESGYVELDTWQHIVSDWEFSLFIEQLHRLEGVMITEGQESSAVAHLVAKDGRIFAVCAPIQTAHERSAVLRNVVATYQRNAKLFRTAINEPDEIWPLYPQAVALVIFPRYSPADIIAAAKYQAYLPPGISRHIIHGRALRVNYPMQILKDPDTKLADKNDQLNQWLQNKLSNRQVRYYAEATYQFDE